MTPDQQREMLRRTRVLLTSWWQHERSGFRVADVQLEGEPDKSEIVITFTHPDRPGSLLGYRWELYDLDPDDPVENDPHSQATILYANLIEAINDIRHRLPTSSQPGAVAWLD